VTSAVIGALRVVLGLDSATFIDGADAAARRMQTLQAQLARVGQRMQAVGARMTLGVTLPLVAIGTQALQAARESEQASAAVRAALDSMGDGAGRTQQQLEDMAGALSRNSLFADDQILTQVTANMLTFGNVSGEAFDRAQQAALDLSARLGTDLQGSTIMVGKALNDPIAGITSLTRVGVAFTDQQREQIRVMTEAGDVAGAQAIILDELNRQYGGQAAALAATDSGQITQAWNQIGEALEAVGKIILPIMADVAVYIRDAAVAFQELSPQTQEWIVIGAGIAAVLGPAIVALGVFLSALQPIGLAIAAMTSPIGLAVIAIGALTYIVWQNWDAIKAWVEGAIEAAGEAIAGIAQAFQDSVAHIQQKLEEIWAAIKATVLGWVEGFYQLGVDMIDGLQRGIESQVSALQTYLGGIQLNMDGSTFVPFDMRPVGQDAINGLTQGIAGGLPQVQQSGADIGAALEEGVRDRLDIRSPSRVFEQLGLFVMEGLGEGLQAGTAGVRGQMVSTAEQIAEATDDLADRMFDKFQNIGGWMVDLARGATTLRQTLANAVSNWGSSITSAGMGELGPALGGLFGNVGGGLLTGIFGGLIGANAAGTNNWRGGLTRVNEMGGEIMDLPRGTRIIPHDVSMEMARSAGSSAAPGITYNIDARGAQAGVADQIMSAIKAYDAQALPARVRQITADPRAT
jgi:hypothetical protein